MKKLRCPRCGGTIIKKDGNLQCFMCSRILAYGDGSARTSEPAKTKEPGRRNRAPRLRELRVPLFDDQMRFIGNVRYRSGEVGKWFGYYYFCNEGDVPWARTLDPHTIGTERMALLRGLDTSCFHRRENVPKSIREARYAIEQQRAA